MRSRVSLIADVGKPRDFPARDFELCSGRRLVSNVDLELRRAAAEQLSRAQSSEDDKFESADVQGALDHEGMLKYIPNARGWFESRARLARRSPDRQSSRT